MKSIGSIILLFISFTSFAQQKETFDLSTYTAPKGWKKVANSNEVIGYATTNNQKATYCQIGIYKSMNSMGSAQLDFETDWQDLLAKPYKITVKPEIGLSKSDDGWEAKSGVAPFDFSGGKSIAMLVTMSGYGKRISFMVLTNTQDYQPEVENFLESVVLTKPEKLQVMKTENSQPVSGNNDINSSILGTWLANASDQSSWRVNNGVMSTISRQYTFNANGTYHFISKTFDPLMDKLLLGKENGTYQINNNSITINPQKSVLEAWSKKDGDKWDKFLTTQSIAFEQTTYRFTKHYFEGNQKWNLVLQADKETKRDGPFSGNTTFTNAWYYGPISATNKEIELPGGQLISAQEIKTEPKQQSTSAANGKFAFSTTNFDDGWISTVRDEWVEVTKGSMKVLLHYPKEGTIFPADPGPLTNAAWNILVSPRYSNLKNYKTTYIATSDRPYLGMSYATENATGKNVFIVFFRQGQTGWLEFIAPDKNTFIQQYKFDPETIQWDSNTDLMIPLANMIGYNKFAVAASDLQGKWSSDFTGIQQLYTVYTGQYAGMNINQSNEEFIFNAGNSYNWKLLAVNGVIGNVKAIEVKSSGQFTVPNNWQVYFSKIESGPRTFHAFWSCIKGARLLNLLDANAPGSGIYTKYGLAK